VRNKPRLKWLRVAGAVFAASVIVSACSGGSSSPQSSSGGSGGKTLKIDFANINDESSFFHAVTQGVKDAEKTIGSEVQVKYYDNKSDGNTTLQNAQLMVNDHPDLIIEFYGTEAVAKSSERLFKNANIPCITVNVPGAGGCTWYDLYNPSLCGQTGTAMGKIAADKGWNGSNTAVVLVAAASFGPEINTCQGYYYEELQKYVPGIAKISSYKDITLSTTRVGDTTYQVNGDGLLDKTFNSVTNVLQAIPSSKHLIVYPIGDDMAIGAWRALDQANRGDDSIIAGLGGDPRTLVQLRTNPSWVAEGDIFFSHWGELLLPMAKAILEHQQTPALTTSPLAVLTKDMTVPDTLIAPMSNYYKDGETNASELPPLIPVKDGDLPGLDKQGPVGNDYLGNSDWLRKFDNVKDLS